MVAWFGKKERFIQDFREFLREKKGGRCDEGGFEFQQLPKSIQSQLSSALMNFYKDGGNKHDCFIWLAWKMCNWHREYGEMDFLFVYGRPEFWLEEAIKSRELISESCIGISDFHLAGIIFAVDGIPECEAVFDRLKQNGDG